MQRVLDVAARKGVTLEVVAFPETTHTAGDAARVVGAEIAQIVKSNVVLVGSVLARRSRLHTGVMAVPLPECSDELLTIVSNVIALTPGTSPLHITRHPTVLYVHVLDMRDATATRRDVQRLADLAFDAFGPDPVSGGEA